MIPRLAHVESWIFDLDNSLYPRLDRPVRADRRPHGRSIIQQLLGCDAERGAAGAEGLFPRARHHPGRADARAWRRPARIPRFRPRHRSRPAHRRSGAGRGARPAARAQVRLHQCRRGSMPAACSTGSASPTRSTACTTSTPWTMCPSPIRAAYAAICARHGIDPGARAVRRRHGAQPRAGQGARHDHGLGRQWLGARRP